jgi:tetratricopeptide (TPR) repeat protein
MEDAWLSTALSEMLSTELAAGDQLRMIPGEDVVHARLSRVSMDVDSVSRKTASQLRNSLNTDLIVSGAYVVVGTSDKRTVRLDVRLQDAASGEILTEISSSGTETDLFQLVGEVGERLREKLGILDMSAEQHAQVLASMPSSREAGELYSKGLLKIRAYDALSARDLLQQSIAIEPTFPLAHLALSEAWVRLGYDQRALEEASRASELSSNLLPTDRLRVQAQHWKTSRNWDKAIEAYRQLHSSFPDEPEYSTLLADCLAQAGRGQEAISMMEPLRGSSPGSAAAQIELAIAEAALAIGDMDRAAKAAQAAISAARTEGGSLLLAGSLRVQGLIFESLGQYDKAIAATDEARSIFEGAGDRFGLASVLEVQGNVLWDRGDLAAALDKYRAELTIVREIGSKRSEASARNNIGLVLYQQGDLKGSKEMWGQAQAAFQELGDKSNTAVVMVNIGGILKDQGDLGAAKEVYQKALTMSQEVHDAGAAVLALRALGTTLDAMGDYAAAANTLNRAIELDAANGHSDPSSESLLDTADVMRHRGDLTGARKYYQDVLVVSQKSGEKSWAAYALFGLGKVALLSADLAGAREYYAQGAQIRKELGETATEAETNLALAELAIAEGRLGEAESLLIQAHDASGKADKQDQGIAAATLMVSAKLAEKRVDLAERELARLPPPEKIQDAEMRMAVGIAQGKVLLASGKRTEAQSVARSVLHEAQRRGSPEYKFESRALLLQAEPARDRKNNDVAALSREAAQAGYRLTAQKIQAEQ